MKDKENSAIAVIQEALSTVRVVKAFGKEEEEEKKFLHRSTANLKKRYELILFQGGFDIAVSLTMAAGTAAVLFLGVCHVQEGTLTLGGLLIVMTYLSQLYAPLQMIGTKATDIQSSLVSVERAFALLDEKPDVHEKPHAKHLVRSEGALTFQDVSFSYNPDRAILQDLSFKIEPGSCVGIVGRTGAGKTTLLSLLLRFYDPTSGRVLLDGVDLKEYQLTDLRNQYAVVFQEPVLFSTTIGENIAYARPGAKESEIIEAAKAAHAHDFIVKMPKGYETRVGDRGMSLSGGERQRISLARAFLRNAPILILDEPTSAVDTRTEALIMEAVDRLMAGRTTFMVAHRLSTLAKCNFLIRMEEGRLISPLSAPSPDELRELVSLKAS